MKNVTRYRRRVVALLLLTLLFSILAFKLSELKQNRLPLIEEADSTPHEVASFFDIQTG